MFRQSVWGPSSFPEYSWFFFYEGINPQRFKCSIQGSHKNATVLVSRAWVSLSHFPLQVSQDNNHLYRLVVSNTHLPSFLLSWASVLIKVGLQPSLCHRAVVPGDSDDIAAHHLLARQGPGKQSDSYWHWQVARSSEAHILPHTVRELMLPTMGRVQRSLPVNHQPPSKTPFLCLPIPERQKLSQGTDSLGLSANIW